MVTSRLVEKHLELIHEPTESEPWGEFAYKDAGDIKKLIELGNDLSNLSTLNAFRQPIFFRGQADSRWRLEPRLYRLFRETPKLSLEWALRFEYDSIRYFKQRAHLFLESTLMPKDNDIGAWLALMQQYSAPTRMLDWTTSFYVALYFAINDQPLEKEGALWFFEIHELMESMQKYEVLSEEQLERMSSNEEEFVDFGLNRAQPRIGAYTSDIKSERMVPQQSVFTFCERLFCDHADLIGNALRDRYKKHEGPFLLTKIVVSSEAKRQLRIHLNKLNLTAGVLFPGMDGVGRAISEIIRAQSTLF